jgi:hypothetical protein
MSTFSVRAGGVAPGRAARTAIAETGYGYHWCFAVTRLLWSRLPGQSWVS